jgi:hypothetical protein
VNARGCLALTLLLTACSQERTPPPTARLAPLSARAGDEIVLDVSAGGDALLARVLPAPEQSDADRTLRVRLVTSNGLRRWHFGDTPVIEARFVPRGEALLVITTTHALVRLDGPDATPRVLDEHVFGPLSLDALGRAAGFITRLEIACELVLAFTVDDLERDELRFENLAGGGLALSRFERGAARLPVTGRPGPGRVARQGRVKGAAAEAVARSAEGLDGRGRVKGLRVAVHALVLYTLRRLA